MRWRTTTATARGVQQDNRENIDPSGEINEKAFKTPVEFRAILAERKDDFRRALVTKLLSYALGRGIQSYDRPAVDGICAAVKADGDRFSSVVAGVVKSYPFQHARGMDGQTAESTSATTWFHPVSDKPAVAPPPESPRFPGQGRTQAPAQTQGENQTIGAGRGSAVAPVGAGQPPAAGAAADSSAAHGTNPKAAPPTGRAPGKKQ